MMVSAHSGSNPAVPARTPAPRWAGTEIQRLKLPEEDRLPGTSRSVPWPPPPTWENATPYPARLPGSNPPFAVVLLN
jgi:hypothetical protein